MKVAKGKKVKMDYELGIDGGDTIESSESRGPQEYIHGTGAMLAGLESRIEGLEPGDEKEGVIPADEAFTPPTTDLPRNEFPEGEEVKEGKMFEAKDPSGAPVKFEVVKVSDDTVTVRFHHPLAGKDIRFKVKILEVSDPN